jgi:hypothetical protein
MDLSCLGIDVKLKERKKECCEFNCNTKSAKVPLEMDIESS